MNRYRVDMQIAGNPHVRIVKAKNAELAAHRARLIAAEDGWTPDQMSYVAAKNETDPHDYWQSADLDALLTRSETKEVRE
jgi:hypothetical protein